MTREIALHCMKSASELESELCEECPIYGQTGCDHCYEDALQYVIAVLEQEPKTDVLDKIMEEIEEKIRPFHIGGIEVKASCLGIIDEYKDKGVEE